MSRMKIRSFAMNAIEKEALCRLQVDDECHGFEGTDWRHASDG